MILFNSSINANYCRWHYIYSVEIIFNNFKYFINFKRKTLPTNVK